MLDLSKSGLVDKNTPRTMRKAFDIIEEVEAYLEAEMGVAPAAKPKGEQPEDLGDGLAERADSLTNSELAILHAQYVAWAGYLNGRLAVIKAGHKLAEMNLANIRADLEREFFKTDIPKVEVPTLVKSDGLYREFQIEDLKLYMMKQILDARVRAYDKSAEAISRLITLRTDEVQAQRRNPQNRGRRQRGKL
jgi:hypothetical protein